MSFRIVMLIPGVVVLPLPGITQDFPRFIYLLELLLVPSRLIGMVFTEFLIRSLDHIGLGPRITLEYLVVVDRLILPFLHTLLLPWPFREHYRRTADAAPEFVPFHHDREVGASRDPFQELRVRVIGADRDDLDPRVLEGARGAQCRFHRIGLPPVRLTVGHQNHRFVP